MSKLNIGCGDKRKPGFINIDISTVCQPDYVWDVTNIPFPKQWAPEGQVERIECDNLMEHLSRRQVIEVMNEFHRVLKDGGTVWIKSPAIWKSPNLHGVLDAVFGDPTHRSYFTERTFDYWNQSDPMRRWANFGKDYGILPFKKVEKHFSELHGEWTLIK